MAVLPHDLTDLRLAPVVLAVDARIEELGRLDADVLAAQIERFRDRSSATRDRREAWLLAEVASSGEGSGWALSLDDRGIRLTHDQHSFVLGMPSNFGVYLSRSEEFETVGDTSSS